MHNRKYAFSWGLIGDLEAGRLNLGPTLRVEAYRLMQFCFRDVLEVRYGAGETDRIFHEAGSLAGRNFFENLLNPKPDSFIELIARLQQALKDLGIGILRVEMADLEAMTFTMTISEDLDCSGLPELGHEICVYDEGFLAGILEAFTGRSFNVKEINCWSTGGTTCRFEARAVG